MYVIRKLFVITLVFFYAQNVCAQAYQPYLDRMSNLQNFKDGKMQYGVSLNLKITMAKKNFGYTRLSLTGGIGLPFGSTFNFFDENHFSLNYIAELDLFRGGLGASTVSYKNQRLLFELRQSFMFVTGWFTENNRYDYVRPISHFVSNSSRPLYDPYSVSVSLGTTFINNLSLKRAQRVGVFGVGYLPATITYINDGPPFTIMNLGDGYDQWWTGSGQVGLYFPSKNLSQIEIKYDKFTGLQPYAYELSTALGIKYIPYKNRINQLLNRQKFEVNVATGTGLGFSIDAYDFPWFDMQHYIHHGNKYSYHNTPVERYGGLSVFYSRTFPY